MKISSAFFAFIPLVAAVPPSNNVVKIDLTCPPFGCTLINCHQHSSLCSERNFEGTCIVEHATIGQCISLPGAFTAQSFGPDAGLTCFVFDQANCAGRSVGPIINGQVNRSQSDSRSPRSSAPNQFYVKCENGAQYSAPQLSYLRKARRSLKLQIFKKMKQFWSASGDAVAEGLAEVDALAATVPVRGWDSPVAMQLEWYWVRMEKKLDYEGSGILRPQVDQPSPIFSHDFGKSKIPHPDSTKIVSVSDGVFSNVPKHNPDMPSST
ncbi:hypothetical protein C8J57DRAFT_1222710 [Mycena rebaudengoi]|nr:hypothetical protein C8J57DRAFT_1222710 [Mycena rebaudengoi]